MGLKAESFVLRPIRPFLLKYSMPEEIKQERILMRGVNWVGDAVMAMPALWAIRRAFPNAKLSLLVKPWVAGLFERDPNVDEIILYEDVHKNLSGKIRLAHELREKNFDRAILLQNALDAALVAYLARIPERIGYSRDMRGPFLSKKIPYNGEDRKGHHIKYFLNLLEEAGIPAGPVNESPWIYLDLEERLKARSLISDLTRPVIGLNPGAAFGSSKKWPPERFGELADRIASGLNGTAIIFGSKAEEKTAREIMKIAPETRSFAGKTTLRELAALLSECDALVTNDSGTMHVGYAVGTPLVALFGSTSVELTGPPAHGNIVIKKDIPCSPCFVRECPKKHTRCMQEITPEEVFMALKKILPVSRAVFFDRDGTLCRDADFLRTRGDLEVFKDIGELAKLKELGFKLIGITNQSGIGRGIVEEGFVKEINRVFIQEHGFDAFYYCPHLPDENCSCRKPSPGMLIKARKDFGLDLRRSYVVGDKERDILAGEAVGARGILLEENSGTPGLKSAVEFIINAENGSY
jgi:heptosyltransferase-2